MGDADDTSPYQAELTGFELAVANAGARAPSTTLFFWFLTDTLNLIRNVTGDLQAKAGLSACVRIRKALRKLLLKHPQATAAVIWCPSKKGITGLELADAAAKAAIPLPQVIDVTPSPVTILKRIKSQLRNVATATPSKLILDRLMSFYNPAATYKALAMLPRADATALA